MLKHLKEQVLEANLLLDKYNLVTFTWGNVSGIDKDNKLMVIKPSGVEYSKLKLKDMVVLDLNSGKTVEGILNPSSDTPTHLELYRNFKDIGGIAHTHSRYATSFAQAGLDVEPLGTTHADYFFGKIPCTRNMKDLEISGEYEKETGKLIVETFNNINPLSIPAVLVKSHGPFTWGKTPYDAFFNSVVLEEVCLMNLNSIALNPKIENMQDSLLKKHFLRKHGENAYYGQKK